MLSKLLCATQTASMRHLKPTWIEGGNALRRHAVRGLEVLLQQQQHGERDGRRALSPDVSLVHGSLNAAIMQLIALLPY